MLQYTTLIGGQVTALLVLVVLQNTLSPQDLNAWGWRIPFAIGGLLAIVVFWMQRRLEETNAFLTETTAATKRGRTGTRRCASIPARWRDHHGAA